jgi:hypothetical protein
MVVADLPVGKSDFVASFAQGSTEAVEDLVEKLAVLPLRDQERIALLRKSMVPWLVRLVRTAPLASAPMGVDGDHMDESVALAAVCIQVVAETIIGPDFRASPSAEAQLNLSLHFEGLGLRLPGSVGHEWPSCPLSRSHSQP